MKIFKSYTYKWWQMGIFKLALLAIGVIFGSFFPEFFQTYLTLFISIAVVASIYVIYISLRKI